LAQSELGQNLAKILYRLAQLFWLVWLSLARKFLFFNVEQLKAEGCCPRDFLYDALNFLKLGAVSMTAPELWRAGAVVARLRPSYEFFLVALQFNF